MAEIDMHDVPSSVDLGEEMCVTIDWKAGHGEQARFLSAVAKPEEAEKDPTGSTRSPDGNWIEIGRRTRNLSEAGEREEFTFCFTVPEDLDPGTYRLRVIRTVGTVCR